MNELTVINKIESRLKAKREPVIIVKKLYYIMKTDDNFLIRFQR